MNKRQFLCWLMILMLGLAPLQAMSHVSDAGSATGCHMPETDFGDDHHPAPCHDDSGQNTAPTCSDCDLSNGVLDAGRFITAMPPPGDVFLNPVSAHPPRQLSPPYRPPQA